jgi:two-component system, OmpR family, response regulator
MDAAPRLLIIGADARRRMAWTSAMWSAGIDVLEVESEKDALRLTGEWRPTGVVYTWPPQEVQRGLDLLRFLRRYDDDILIVLVGAHMNVPSLREVLAAGADLYFPDSYEEALLVVQVELELQRRLTVSKSKIRCGDLVVDIPGHRVWRGESEVLLTSVEFRLLVLLIEHCGEVVSKALLLKEVWRRHDDARLGGGHLVEVHVGSLRKKLNTLGSPILHTVRGQGFILRMQSSE